MKTAILMAAGLGTRMRPLTNDTPKPLVEVNGVPMIETTIKALHHSKIEEIYLVTGYLNEKFEVLKEKYENINIIYNSEYSTKNNISSIYAAKDILGLNDVFICEADLYISDINIFNTEHEKSCYYGKMLEGYSADWVFDLDENGRITRVGKNGKDCYNMVGITYFNKKDALILKNSIIEAYSEEGHGALYYDDVVNNNLDKLDLCIHPVKEEQIIEIDTVEELRSFEQSLK